MAWHVHQQACLYAASWPTIPAEQGCQARITWPSLRLEVSRAVSRAASCGGHGMTSQQQHATLWAISGTKLRPWRHEHHHQNPVAFMPLSEL